MYDGGRNFDIEASFCKNVETLEWMCFLYKINIQQIRNHDPVNFQPFLLNFSNKAKLLQACFLQIIMAEDLLYVHLPVQKCVKKAT